MVTIRKSVRNEFAGKINYMLQNAKDWMKQKYPTVDFEYIEFIFSSSFRKSRYYRNAHNKKYDKPTIQICTRGRLILYNMKSLKIKKTDIWVGVETQTMCAIIHELTHHMQYETGLPTGELETTRNELEYLKAHDIESYNEIMQI